MKIIYLLGTLETFSNVVITNLKKKHSNLNIIKLNVQLI